ncbi:MAG: aminoglycoside phosphotransferase family protein [Clostridia bacterium]|nr:aminoglycoside phosphotransferase family protein [Clostridia bacterium]
MSFQDIIAHFGIADPIVAKEEICSGNINRTYLVTVQEDDGAQKQYIVQRINSFVFKHPDEVMTNILAVTEHIKKKLVEKYGSYDRRVLSFLKAEDGKPYYYTTSTKHFFRIYEYVYNTVAHNMVHTPNQFYEAGREFGEFQGLLADFPADTLTEIIPDFHNTPKRYEAFREAIENDEGGRVAEMQDEIRFLLDRYDDCGRIVNSLNAGIIPRRVTHNDTKINNVLFDTETGKAVCVIDLDTVMPGSSLYDFGDAVRFGASTAAEDERDLSKVSLDLNLFEQFTRGFIKGTDGLLTDEEIHLLPYGAYIMTLELAVRFMTDYLNGDKYFKVDFEDHNLVRTRNQMRLLQDMEAKWTQMCEISERCRLEAQ